MSKINEDLMSKTNPPMTPPLPAAPLSMTLTNSSPADNTVCEPSKYSRLHGSVRKILSTEVVRFLLVGCCNTLFSILLQAAMAILLAHLFPKLTQSLIAMAAVICAMPFGITFSFLGFKHFVFKTQGNYIEEWIRCFAVYTPTVPAAVIIVGLTTGLFEMTSISHLYAKDAAFVVNSAIIASYSYFANKKFSFKQ